MVERGGDIFVLYPIYFDVNAPRAHRRVPRELAVRDPTVDRIAKAVTKLNLSPTIERERHHPARWHAREGRVLIPALGSKEVLLRQIAERLSGRPEAGAQTAE